MGEYKTKTVTFKGSSTLKVYNGFDPVANSGLVIHPGETVEVSEQKAAQLMADFPDLFTQGKGPGNNGEAPSESGEAANAKPQEKPAKAKKKAGK